jgi:hypothetical protein
MPMLTSCASSATYGASHVTNNCAIRCRDAHVESREHQGEDSGSSAGTGGRATESGEARRTSTPTRCEAASVVVGCDDWRGGGDGAAMPAAEGAACRLGRCGVVGMLEVDGQPQGSGWVQGSLGSWVTDALR